jgi:ABC-type dipeptide/oligopeptide/nickel transport system permease subunit
LYSSLPDWAQALGVTFSIMLIAPSWGGMIKEYYGFIILDSAYLAIIPGVAIILLVLAFMTVGNSLRDALDVKEVTSER